MKLWPWPFSTFPFSRRRLPTKHSPSFLNTWDSTWSGPCGFSLWLKFPTSPSFSPFSPMLHPFPEVLFLFMPLSICMSWTLCSENSSTWVMYRPFFCCCSFLFIFRATPMAYRSSQARGQIWAAAAGNLHHSHSNARSDLHLWSTLQLTGQRWILNPLRGARDGTASSCIIVGLVITEPQQEPPSLVF